MYARKARKNIDKFESSAAPNKQSKLGLEVKYFVPPHYIAKVAYHLNEFQEECSTSMLNLVT